MLSALDRILREYVRVGDLASPEGQALLQERYRTIRQQIPLIYAITLACVIGLHSGLEGAVYPLFWPGYLLIAFVVVRLLYWLRNRGRIPSVEQIARQLAQIQWLAVGITILYCAWTLIVFERGDRDEQNYVILFGSLGAIGCAYGLSSFPNAARMPLLFYICPVAIRLIFALEPAHVGFGICLALVAVLILQLLGQHERHFVQLVRSRARIAAEGARAVRAERQALAEQAKTEVIAHTDHLTGLSNRRSFIEALNMRVVAAQSGAAASKFTLAMLDLDGFKPINDSFGHITGDAILARVGARLKEVIGSDDMVARIGGDEFAIILADCAAEVAALRIGARISAALNEPLLEAGREFRMSACCGLTLFDAKSCDAALAMVQADIALYEAKRRGHGEVTLYSRELERVHARHSALAMALRAPSIRDEIGLAFQPIYDLASMKLLSFEALARWRHAELGDIPPSEFVPIAEQINVIEEINGRLLVRAIEEARNWPDTVQLSANLSAVELCTRMSSTKILAALSEHGMAPSRLKIEVTETALLADFAAARANLSDLKRNGVQIVLDDFGAGFASIAYLRELRFDAIKLDGSLVTSIVDSLASRQLLQGVLNLCASLQTPCIAEHIETPEQYRLLCEMGCRRGQGYLLSPPLPAEEARLLARSAVAKLRQVS